MRRGRIARRALTTAAIALLALAPSAFAGTTERVSLATLTGAQGNNTSFEGAVSADGRFVAFTSAASNLVPGDTNGRKDVFVRDRVTGVTERVSVGPLGAQANGDSPASGPAIDISADGRVVSFISNASNLVAGDTNNTDDAFVHDRFTGVTERVNVSSSGAQSNGFIASNQVSLSGDGRYAVFTARASDLAGAPAQFSGDVYLRDRLLGTTERISVSAAGAPGNITSDEGVISDDGRYVAFRSAASNLAPSDTNNTTDILLRDRTAGTTELVTVAPGGVQANRQSRFPAISGDGRVVAFTTEATNLAPGDTNGAEDYYVHDLTTGLNERVNVSSSEQQTFGVFIGIFGTPAVNQDGSVVAFTSVDGPTLVGPGTSYSEVAYVRDRNAGTTERVSQSTAGAEPNSFSNHALSGVSADGRVVAFYSAASNLVPGDTNGRDDVFVHARGSADRDGDGVADASDNCPDAPNPGQANNDGDGQGDACDPDDDNDGVADGGDNCQLIANGGQEENDGDGQGDACDPDDDNDGVEDGPDNCRFVANTGQEDNDGDGQGDACDPDDDNDGVEDAGDNCQFAANSGQDDNDADGQGDACDADDDNDGVADGGDNCAFVSNPGQANNDGDSQGDACDSDDDNDGVEDGDDNCPLNANTDQKDTDGDGTGDACDPDNDNDGVDDDDDNCPAVPNADQRDTDGDGTGDACDPTPGSTPGKVTGGGWITTAKNNFGFDAKYTAGMDAPRGEVTYKDKGQDVALKSTAITSVIVLSPTHAVIRGTGLVNGTQPVEVRIEVEDKGEPGRNDTFHISWPGYEAFATLNGGNIQIH